jgi:UDP-N-acetylmuramoylalanine--D-glutamate ligase
MAMTGKQFDTVIVGLGKTGYSCARFLAAQHVDFAITDNRAQPPMLAELQKHYPDVPLFLGRFNADVLQGAGRILISPGVSLHEPAIAIAKGSGIRICGDIELFCQNITAPVLAVTGSNGKSTVTTLIAEMARAAGLITGLGGNIGVPALDLLSEGDVDIFMLELSSFQLETVFSLNAMASVVLNVSEDHMDRYTCLDDYAAAKAHIYDGDGTMVINLDDPLVAGMSRQGRKTVGYSLGNPDAADYGVCRRGNARWLANGSEYLMPVEEVCLKGDHNIANSLAALALGDVINLPREGMLEVLRTFPGLPHRCQRIAEINGVTWYDDSKGTNTGAACAAIKGLSQNRNLILIAGGDGKGADFSNLAMVAADYLRAAVLIGRDGPKIKQVLQGIVPVYEASDMQEAVNKAAEQAMTGDIVLLSPACASFDMFEDYQARGNAFIKAVKSLLVN